MNTLPEFHEPEDNKRRRAMNHAHAAFDILTTAYAEDQDRGTADIFVPMGGTETLTQISMAGGNSGST